MNVEEEVIRKYSDDVKKMGGYVYTGVKARKSMDIFNKRASMAIRELLDARNGHVIDIGCGDGTYTVELVKDMGAASAVGIEPSDAWQLARQKHAAFAPQVEFRQGSAYALPYPDDNFDLAFMRGVLHHLDDPIVGLREAFRVARSVFLLEPNGYNPAIKLIEKLSPYHRAHGERSFAPARIKSWLHSLGGNVAGESYRSLVPLFCPDRMAMFLDWLSPRWERLPLAPTFTCGLYCVLSKRM